jgi:hypothetical protein
MLARSADRGLRARPGGSRAGSRPRATLAVRPRRRCAPPGRLSDLPNTRLRGARRTSRPHRLQPFVSGRESAGGAQITYWEYRPTLGWRERTVVASAADISALAGTPLLDSQIPALVALETLPGANHYDFAPGEEPPWRWQIERR